jgi:hypothetical protein
LDIQKKQWGQKMIRQRKLWTQVRCLVAPQTQNIKWPLNLGWVKHRDEKEKLEIILQLFCLIVKIRT